MASTWPILRAVRNRSLGAALAMGAGLGAQETPSVHVSRIHRAPTIDGNLAEWSGSPSLRIERPEQVADGVGGWSGPADASLELRFAYDPNYLYLAGTVRDDVHVAASLKTGAPGIDAIEVVLGAAGDEGDAALPRAEDLHLLLTPLQEARPWRLAGPRSGSSLTGIAVAAHATGSGGYTFEAAIPFHQLANLRPGQHMLGCSIALLDVDAAGGETTRLSWTGKDPQQGPMMGRLVLDGDGPLVSELPARLLTILVDLQYLLVPLLLVAVLLVLLRLWPKVDRRYRWLRPALLGGGVLLF